MKSVPLLLTYTVDVNIGLLINLFIFLRCLQIVHKKIIKIPQFYKLLNPTPGPGLASRQERPRQFPAGLPAHPLQAPVLRPGGESPGDAVPGGQAGRRPRGRRRRPEGRPRRLDLGLGQKIVRGEGDGSICFFLYIFVYVIHVKNSKI